MYCKFREQSITLNLNTMCNEINIVKLIHEIYRLHTSNMKKNGKANIWASAFLGFQMHNFFLSDTKLLFYYSVKLLFYYSVLNDLINGRSFRTNLWALLGCFTSFVRFNVMYICSPIYSTVSWYILFDREFCTLYNDAVRFF